MSNVADALSRLTPEQRAILEKKLQQKRAQKAAAKPVKMERIQSRPQGVGNPLSAGQERLFMLSQLTPDGSVYNITEAVRINGQLNGSALKQSVAQIVERHDSFRSVFSLVNGEPQQAILPPNTPEFTVVSVDDQTTVEQLVAAEQSRPFILSQGPLYRFKLLEINPTEHILILTMHHMIADGWSFGVLFKELSARYAANLSGEMPKAEPLKIQYADFAYWQRQWLDSDKAQAQLTYWQNNLDSGVEPLQLPHHRSLPALDESGGSVSRTISPDLVGALQSTSGSAGMTLFVTLLAGLKATLHRYTGQTDLIVCSPAVGRKQVETEELIGYFNNIIAIRTELSEDLGMDQLQARIQEKLIAASENDELPFQQVANLPHLARVPLTRALFTLQDGLNETLVLPETTTESVELESSTSDFDIALYMEWYADSLMASLEYKPGVFDQEVANEFLEAFNGTLELMATTPTIALKEFAKIEQPLIDNQPIDISLNGSHNGTSAAHEIVPNGQLSSPIDDDQMPDELEAQLIAIWEDVLGLKGICRTDNFFELGGHSMSALRLFAKIEQEVTQEKLPLALLFQAPTVAEIAQIVRSDDTQAAWSLVVPLQEKGSKPPLFCIHAAGGNVLLYSDLARHLASNDQPVYGIQSQGLDGQKPILKTVEEMGEVYTKEILSVRQTGPYLLAGYCLGGTVAFDVAQRLTALGHEVAFLGLLETYNWAHLKESSLLGNLKYQGQRAEFMVRNFMMLDPEQRQGFFKGKLERVQGRTSVWRGSIQSIISNKQSEEKSEDAILAELWESNDEAADAYIPNIYPGKITQFIPAKDYAEYDDPALLWDDIAQGGVDVHKLPVYPAGMVYEPFVGTLAAHITECIDMGLSNLI